MSGFRHLKDVATLKLDQETCVGCGRCAEVCPHEVLALEGKKAVLVDRNACMECGACATNCPVSAISVESGVGCAIGMLGEYLQEIRNRKIRSARP